VDVARGERGANELAKLLACAGCGVMLFNWIVINFVITGLHSYA
jgi:hypothetical protein